MRSSRLTSLFSSTRPSSRGPRPRRFEQLEARQMMSVTPLTAAEFGTPSKTDPGFVSAAAIPPLSSLPGAPAKIYLDFNGHFQATPAISTFPPNLASPAFTVDGEATNPSARNDAIRDIWARVAEDYAPFNVNVTTVDPGDFSHASHNLRVVVTGESPTSPDEGGLAMKGSFAVETLENVVYVFTRVRHDSLEETPGSLRELPFIGKVASHEAGHAFGLDEQALWQNGQLVEEFHPGLGAKGPIMGNPRATTRTIWWRGQDKVGQVQDDMAIIASAVNGFGFRPDEMGSSFANPQTLTNYDPVFGALTGSGVISTTSDVDVFRFDWSGGFATIRLDIGTLGQRDTANLDPKLELYRQNSDIATISPAPSRTDQLATLVKQASPGSGQISMDLPAGVYFVKVGSQGAYGDVGQYVVNVLDRNGPRIDAASIATVSAGVTSVLVTFNKDIDAATFTTADVTATGANLLSVAATNSPRAFLVTVTPTASTGAWSFTVGPNVKDRYGNLMDQNSDRQLGKTNDVFIFNNLVASELSAGGISTITKKSRLSPRLVDLAFTTR